MIERKSHYLEKRCHVMKRRNKSLLAIITALGMLALIPCGSFGATQELGFRLYT